jgi:Sulfotransferase family
VSLSAADAQEYDQLPDPVGRVQWLRLYLSSAWRAWRTPGLPDVERFCFFIGYARSGHSLIGSLLNAHPEMVISHERDAIQIVQKHFGRSQLYSLILERDEAFGAMGRVWTGYDYTVPHGHQGRWDRLKVIGDKRGRRTALELAQRPEVLDRLRRTVGVPIRVIHITRNPFDNIVTEASRRELSLETATRWYEKSCRSIAAVRPRLESSELIELPHESFAADPQGVLAELCAFLGVEADPAYLESCAAVVWPSTKRRRDTMEWSKEDIERVEELIARYEFLGHYTFDD